MMNSMVVMKIHYSDVQNDDGENKGKVSLIDDDKSDD